jgi:glycogen debranching enzyme
MNIKGSTLRRLALPVVLLVGACSPEGKRQPENRPAGLLAGMAGVESLTGRAEYIHSPCVTAGDRVYLVGHQDGRFPDLGWHVTGEMGGLWDHPIKLLDGFTATLEANGKSFCLSEANQFVNYPFAGKHVYGNNPAGLRVERFQFVPDGREAVVVEYSFTNEGTEAKRVAFSFTGFSDLRPTWLGERTGMRDGGDFATWDEPTGTWIAKDSLNPWFVQFGAATAPAAHGMDGGACDYQPAGKGCRATLRYALDVPAGATVTLPFAIAGSYASEAKAKATYAEVQGNAARLLAEKRKRYETIAAQTRLTVPDKDLERAFRWTKYNTDWLVRDVPEIGRGLSAGLPDYPWWFGTDNTYALQGVIATGNKDLVYRTIDLLHGLSQKTNGNGRILHEVSTNGAVFNPGNVNETPQFISLLWTVYAWTGDKAFLQKYYPAARQGLDWLVRQNDKDGNGLPEGFGMMEIHGLDSEMIDVAAYSQKAFADAAEMAAEMGDDAAARQYRQAAARLAQKINTDFWVPGSASYADFIGTPRQALRLVDDAIVRADTLKKPWAVAELKETKAAVAGLPPGQKRGFVLHHNWVVNTPMQTGIADTAKALAALRTGSRFVNPFGVFVTGIDRDETAGRDEGSFAGSKKIFSYTGAVMTLPTGVQAVAENNYGRPDEALGYLRRMTRSFSYALPGSIYEVSPDYGMMTQAWNLYSYAVPVVGQFFGIHPAAHRRTVQLRPRMPTAWNDARLENVAVGDNQLGVTYHRTADGLQLSVTQTRPDWKVVFALPAGRYRRWQLNGKAVSPRTEGNVAVLEAIGKAIALEVAP